MKQIYANIRQWASDRNIIQGCDLKDQYPKLISEFGELTDHVDQLHDLVFFDPEIGYTEQAICDLQAAIKDDIGDCLVVLTILAAQNGTEIENINGGGCADKGAHPHSFILRLAKTLGRLGDAIAKNQAMDIDVTIMVAVDYLSGVAHDYGLRLSDCAQAAYEDIKDRKGVMYNGTFIKSTDPAYEHSCKMVKKLELEDRVIREVTGQ